MSILTKAVNNALVWYDSRHTDRWFDAVGENVLKYLTHWESAGTADADQIDGWTTTLVEVGAGESTVALTTTKGGHLLITTAGNENDGATLQLDGEAFQMNAAQPLYFGIKFKIDVASDVDFLVGMCITDTALLGGMTDGVYFRKIDGTTNVEFVTEKNSVESSVVVDTFAAATDVVYEFLYDGETVYAYVDGELATSADCSGATWPDDEVLTPSIEMLSGVVTTTDEMSIDWLRVIQCQ